MSLNLKKAVKKEEECKPFPTLSDLGDQMRESSTSSSDEEEDRDRERYYQLSCVSPCEKKHNLLLSLLKDPSAEISECDSCSKKYGEIAICSRHNCSQRYFKYIGSDRKYCPRCLNRKPYTPSKKPSPTKKFVKEKEEDKKPRSTNWEELPYKVKCYNCNAPHKIPLMCLRMKTIPECYNCGKEYISVSECGTENCTNTFFKPLCVGNTRTKCVLCTKKN